MNAQQQASAWAEGNFGEGYCLYARLKDKWYSVNGVHPFVSEIRWEVNNPKIIGDLNAFCNLIEEGKAMTDLPKIETLPQPPAGAKFSLQKVEKISIPHPYCITPKHVEYAADHCGGMLTLEAIRGAEKRGARCDICAHSKKGILTVDQHEQTITLFIRVPQNHDLNAVEGLHNYLFTNKETFVNLGIQGFAFPNK